MLFNLRFVSVLHENGTVSDRYENNSCPVSDRHKVRPLCNLVPRAPFREGRGCVLQTTFQLKLKLQKNLKSITYCELEE